jgi:uncharacterized protein (DUF58 family)
MTAGRATLVLAAAFVLGAAAFDSPSLYVPGVALALLVAGLRIWVGLAARRAHLERQEGPWTIVEGDPYPLEVTVRLGRIPLPGGQVVHPLGEYPATIPSRVRIRARLELRSLRRGRRDLEPVTLVLADPLRLNRVEIRGEEAGQVLVLPRIEPVVVARDRAGAADADGIIDGLDGLGAAGLDTRPIDFEIDGLRPYREGSPASRIHWPSVARSGEMVEHRLVAGADASPLVVLDASHPIDAEALDRAVRAAASLCVYLAPSGGCGLLLSGDRAPREIDRQLNAWPRAHARLAMVRGGASPPSAWRARSGGALFWVNAAADPPADLRGSPSSAFYLVSANPLRGLETVFTVAGCQGQRLAAARRRLAAVRETR